MPLKNKLCKLNLKIKLKQNFKNRNRVYKNTIKPKLTKINRKFKKKQH